MRKFKRILFLIGIAILPSVLFAQEATSTMISGKISGKVADDHSQPLSGAVITATLSPSGSKYITASKSDGTFTLQGLKAGGPYTIVVSFTGYKSDTTANAQVGAGETLTLQITLHEVPQDLIPITVGSRGAPRTAVQSAVPIDIINVKTLSATTGRADLMSQLNIMVPSFNYNKQCGSDMADAVDLASLRGLGYDQTLVLVNGKRRYPSANVITGGLRGRGNSGTDLNAIPEGAIDRIEVLRDGASAQYGSDAIAGVVNILLRKDVNHLNINIGGSGYYDHKYNSANAVDPTLYWRGSQLDGKTLDISMNYGLPIGKSGGFINISGNFRDAGETFRAEPDTNYSVNKNAVVASSLVRRAAGDGTVIAGGGMYNMEIPVKGTKTTFYSFGGYNYKNSQAYANTRLWSSGATKYPTNAQGQLLFDPSIMKVYDPTPKGLDTAHVMYTPGQQVYLKDMSAAAGFRGEIGDGWHWDISSNTGYNDFHVWGKDTYNASIALPDQATKTRFDDGGYSFLQHEENLDLSKHFDGFAQGLTFAVGGEFRYEQYKIYAGEPDSYVIGPATLNGKPKAGGSQGYPGNQPADVADAHRTNTSGYIELTADLTDRWLVDLAQRFENYSDFGFLTTQKLATRYKLTDNFNVRGSVSTGFRAPSLQQINFSNTNTTVTTLPDGTRTFAYTKIVPNTSLLAREAGIPNLTQETSTNASLGFTWKPVSNFLLTVDGYNVNVKNRIVFSGQYSSSSAGLSPALTSLMAAEGVSKAIFFANAVNTTNQGIDVVADYHTRLGKNRLNVVLSGSFQRLMIDKINIPSGLKNSPNDSATFFNDREQSLLKSSAPPAKVALSVEYVMHRVTVGARATYFGKLSQYGNGISKTPPPGARDIYQPWVALDNGTIVPELFHYGAKTSTDIYATVKLTKFAKIALGVDNVFNVHPDKAEVPGSYLSQGDGESGGVFDAVQMGFNGMQLWGKLIFDL
ncbi:TonB-dependent receptor [Puia dinghuensis]|uniref:TonB-dependent receptor n=1 Tax=Puia dinghuensis TaxID=1792502 RepID=A0A8J2XUF7_9BACT|nr:TonB-dependent receptor [Puia dinghuensis]GGB25619.1 TonB-dependent receptor [Puia dinghuensis]